MWNNRQRKGGYPEYPTPPTQPISRPRVRTAMANDDSNLVSDMSSPNTEEIALATPIMSRPRVGTAMFIDDSNLVSDMSSPNTEATSLDSETDFSDIYDMYDPQKTYEKANMPEQNERLQVVWENIVLKDQSPYFLDYKQDKFGNNALNWATRKKKNYVEIVKDLLDLGADPNIQNNYQNDTPLVNALFRKDEKMVAMLLKYGADPNIQSAMGNTPLILASGAGGDAQNFDIVKLLLNNGANPNIQNDQGMTALNWALESLNIKGEPEIAELLLKNGANPNLKPVEGNTPLLNASWKRDKKIAEMLLKYGADPNIQTDMGNTPLSLASGAGKDTQDSDLVKLLLNNDLTDPNIQDSNGNTALNWALKFQTETDPKIVEMLLENGANPNLRNKNGTSPLLDATLFKDEKIVEMLLKYGADPHLADKRGVDPFYAERVTGRGKVRNMLEKKRRFY
jgi:ankyrin repeat protein